MDDEKLLKELRKAILRETDTIVPKLVKKTTQSLVGKIVNIPGATTSDNKPIDIEVLDAVDCYNRAFIIINNKYIASYKEMEEYLK